MVDESRDVALARGVDDLVVVECHEVHVVEAAQLLLALLPAGRVDDLTHILDDELARGAVLLELDAPAFVGGLEELQRQRRFVVAREGAVAARVAAEAEARQALLLHHLVLAVDIAAAVGQRAQAGE